MLVILYAFFGGMKTASVGGILKMLILFVTLFALGIVAWQGLMEAPEMLVNKPAGFLSIWGISTGSILNNLASIIVGMICTQTVKTGEQLLICSISNFELSAHVILDIIIDSIDSWLQYGELYDYKDAQNLTERAKKRR